MPNLANCPACGNPILWVQTVGGYKMPLNAEPVEGGNIVMIDGVAHTLKKHQQAEAPKYTSHLTTCIHSTSRRKADDAD